MFDVGSGDKPFASLALLIATDISSVPYCAGAVVGVGVGVSGTGVGVFVGGNGVGVFGTEVGVGVTGAVVGFGVGALVGTCVGAFVGALVGVFVGTFVTPAPGVGVGLAAAVGPFVGPTVGVPPLCPMVGVGSSVIPGVGLCVPVGETASVGTFVGVRANSTRFAGIKMPVPPSTITVTTAVVGDGDGVEVGVGCFSSPITQPVRNSPAAKQIAKTPFLRIIKSFYQSPGKGPSGGIVG